MAPHLDNVELDMVTRLSAEKKGPEEILAAISKRRRKMKIATPKIWAVRRAVACVTHKRGVVEARGRKKKWNAVQNRSAEMQRPAAPPAAHASTLSDKIDTSHAQCTTVHYHTEHHNT